MNQPRCLAVDSQVILPVADLGNDRILLLNPQPTDVRTLPLPELDILCIYKYLYHTTSHVIECTLLALLNRRVPWRLTKYSKARKYSVSKRRLTMIAVAIQIAASTVSYQQLIVE